MWKQYRKTLYPTQALILIVCGAMVIGWHMPLVGALIFFLIMQASAVIGAIWAVRIRNKVMQAQIRAGIRSEIDLDK